MLQVIPSGPWAGAALICASLFTAPAFGAPRNGLDLQRMCQGADKVKALSVMCYSYLDGFLDTVSVYEKGRAAYCIEEGDKERLPSEIVSWLRAHPDSVKEPAPLLLKKALDERFPCKGGKK